MLDLIGTTSRIWRTIIMWDEAINTNPIEQLEKRVAALEQEARIKNLRTGSVHRDAVPGRRG
jgi:hypothetical protein